MKEILLTQGKVALVDDADYEAVSQFKWHAMKKRGKWYAARAIQKSDGTWTRQYLHQFLMPGTPMIDHKDRDGLNNQRENLRPCTRSQNRANSNPSKKGTSTFSGVTWHRRDKKWQAQIKFNLKDYFLGYFYSEEAAARAYDEAAKKFHKDFARLNFPNYRDPEAAD